MSRWRLPQKLTPVQNCLIRKIKIMINNHIALRYNFPHVAYLFHHFSYTISATIIQQSGYFLCREVLLVGMATQHYCFINPYCSHVATKWGSVHIHSCIVPCSVLESSYSGTITRKANIGMLLYVQLHRDDVIDINVDDIMIVAFKCMGPQSGTLTPKVCLNNALPMPYLMCFWDIAALVSCAFSAIPILFTCIYVLSQLISFIFDRVLPSHPCKYIQGPIHAIRYICQAP